MSSRPAADIRRDHWREPAAGAFLVLLLMSQVIDLVGLLFHRDGVWFAGFSMFVVAAAIGSTLLARNIRNGWPYPDGISPAARLRTARAAEGIPPESLSDIYRGWVVDFGRGLAGRRRFARRDRVKTWIVMFILIAFWATYESFGDVGVGGLSGFFTKLAVGAAVSCLVIGWVEIADRLCARRDRRNVDPTTAWS